MLFAMTQNEFSLKLFPRLLLNPVKNYSLLISIEPNDALNVFLAQINNQFMFLYDLYAWNSISSQ